MLQKKKATPQVTLVQFIKDTLPTVDNLRNLLLTPTTEVLSVFHEAASFVTYDARTRFVCSRRLKSLHWNLRS